MIVATIQLLLTLCQVNREKTDLPYPSLPVAKEYILFSSCTLLSCFSSFISLSSRWRGTFYPACVTCFAYHWTCASDTVFYIICSLYAIVHLHNLLPLHVWITIFCCCCCCVVLYIYLFIYLFSLHVLLSLLFFSYKGSDKYWVSISGQWKPSTISLKQAAFFPALPTCPQ